MRSSESTGSDDLDALFTSAVMSLAEGNLTFQPPFDLATSAALAANIDLGDLAQRLFDATAQRDTGYRISIHATAPGVPDREVVNTNVASTALLVALLDGLLDEYCPDDPHKMKETPSGG